MRKTPKFLVGDHVYVQKIARGRKVILFGVINHVRGIDKYEFRTKRHGTRRKYKYYVRFDESVVQVVAGGRRKRELVNAWVSENALHKYTNEEDVVRKLLGDDYL